MEKIDTHKMIGFRIIEIFKVSLGNTLMALYFNLEKNNQKFHFDIEISDDGETILYNQRNEWINSKYIEHNLYSMKSIKENRDKLSALLNTEIKHIFLGVGNTLKTKKVIYYFKIITTINEFLFFNNGDEGAYSFDNINEILSKDIYEYEWIDKTPIHYFL
ncbi:hypothetical protein ACS5NO_10335 [Larkinella sp. GY13]|uniref:hypothetical protein n=1 Tax=Larkinella sp. GY13 TaxID=3453720 RepID=UPI003EE8C53E